MSTEKSVTKYSRFLKKILNLMLTVTMDAVEWIYRKFLLGGVLRLNLNWNYDRLQEMVGLQQKISLLFVLRMI